MRNLNNVCNFCIIMKKTKMARCLDWSIKKLTNFQITIEDSGTMGTHQPLLLFFDTFSHEIVEELNLDLVSVIYQSVILIQANHILSCHLYSFFLFPSVQMSCLVSSHFIFVWKIVQHCTVNLKLWAVTNSPVQSALSQTICNIYDFEHNHFITGAKILSEFRYATMIFMIISAV